MPSRRMAREQALQALYSVTVGKREPNDVLTETIGDEAPSVHRAFVRDLLFGTLEHSEEADAEIGPLLQGWTLERLPTIDRLILRMADYELRYEGTPPAVVMDEAVELAKKFSTEDSGRYVNGVLAALVRSDAT
ncbi:MAG: transcription antitermination factor NusB [Candidatus Eremiobacteraeota bacterium]|nr:transcription antitermination factor NusB [Candidatus Eremiobacteraeota bacterium]